MVLSSGGPESPILSMVPWTRVVRREKLKVHNGFVSKVHVVDFVHRLALGDFVVEVLVFAEVARMRMMDAGRVFSTGKGHVNSLNQWIWSGITPQH